jgi:hypothetical protein
VAVDTLAPQAGRDVNNPSSQFTVKGTIVRPTTIGPSRSSSRAAAVEASRRRISALAGCS